MEKQGIFPIIMLNKIFGTGSPFSSKSKQKSTAKDSPDLVFSPTFAVWEPRSVSATPTPLFLCRKDGLTSSRTMLTAPRTAACLRNRGLLTWTVSPATGIGLQPRTRIFCRGSCIDYKAGSREGQSNFEYFVDFEAI